MKLKDYILTYEADGKVVANLFDYYEFFIKPLDKRFAEHSYYSNKTVLCFFKDHQDINPSMGYINSRKHKKIKVCHCLGCGRTADVVRLHQLMSSQWMGVELTEKEACLDLAAKFNIPIDDFDELDDEDFEGAYIRNIKKLDKLTDRYTIREFSSALLNLRKNSQSGIIDLSKVNSECVKMIATNKVLYD